MASAIVGRTNCPECSFTSAHVKQSEKCLYRHCPECGATYHTKGERQRADLMAKTRPDTKAGQAPAPTPAKPATAGAAAPVSAAPPAAPAKPKGGGFLFNLGG